MAAFAGRAAAEPAVWLAPNAAGAASLGTAVWPKVANVAGIKLYITWLRAGSDQDLARVAAVARQQHLRVAIEVGGLLTPEWGDGIAERSLADETPPLRRWQQLGGAVDVIELDGPIRRALGGGDAGNRREPSSGLPITVIARELDEYLIGMTAAFPGVEFHLLVNFPNWGWRGGPDYHARGVNHQNLGDYFDVMSAVLPVTQPDPPCFAAITFDNPYDYATGRAPTSSQEARRIDWVGRIADGCDVARRYGLGCALILNDEQGGQASDRAFAANTLAFARLIKRRRIGFDHLLVQSWYPYPQAIVGERLPSMLAVAETVARGFAAPAAASHATTSRGKFAPR